MKILMILYLAVLLFQPAQGQTNGMQFFEGTWQQALDMANKEDKLIFVDCYTTWCPPCSFLAKTIFPKKDMGDLYNSKFINVKMDMEKEPGRTLAKQYEVSAYPTLMFVNARGFKVAQMVGVKNPDTLLTWPAKLPKSDASTAEERFKKGERSDSFVNAYCEAFINAKRPEKVEMVLEVLMKERGADILYKQPYFGLVAVTDIDSAPAMFLVNNRQKFESIYGEETIAAKLVAMYTSPFQFTNFYRHGPPRTFLPEAYEALREKMKIRDLPALDYMKRKMDFYVACRNGSMEMAFQLGDSTLQQAKPWQFYDLAIQANRSLHGSYRPKAARWAEQAALNTNDKIVEKNSLQIALELLTLAFIPIDPATI